MKNNTNHDFNKPSDLSPTNGTIHPRKDSTSNASGQIQSFDRLAGLKLKRKPPSFDNFIPSPNNQTSRPIASPSRHLDFVMEDFDLRKKRIKNEQSSKSDSTYSSIENDTNFVVTDSSTKNDTNLAIPSQSITCSSPSDSTTSTGITTLPNINTDADAPPPPPPLEPHSDTSPHLSPLTKSSPTPLANEPSSSLMPPPSLPDPVTHSVKSSVAASPLPTTENLISETHPPPVSKSSIINPPPDSGPPPVSDPPPGSDPELETSDPPQHLRRSLRRLATTRKSYVEFDSDEIDQFLSSDSDEDAVEAMPYVEPTDRIDKIIAFRMEVTRVLKPRPPPSPSPPSPSHYEYSTPSDFESSSSSDEDDSLKDDFPSQQKNESMRLRLHRLADGIYQIKSLSSSLQRPQVVAAKSDGLSQNSGAEEEMASNELTEWDKWEEKPVSQYLVKLEGWSYLHLIWFTEDEMYEKFGYDRARVRISRFMNQREHLLENGDEDDIEAANTLFDPAFTQVDRILTSIYIPPDNTELFLVKWRGMSYAYCTWETATDLNDDDAVSLYRLRNVGPAKQRELNKLEKLEQRKRQEELKAKWQAHCLREKEEVAASDPPAEETSLPSDPIKEETSLPSDPIKEETNLPSDPPTEETSLPSDSLTEETNLPSDPIKEETGLPSDPPTEETNLPSDTLAKSSPDAFYYLDSFCYRNEHTLRDYQHQGLNWLIKAYNNSFNVILADEMGLGKTCQTIAFMHHLHYVMGISEPFIVVAPLSTIQHWKREIEEWTSFNVVVYHDPVKGTHSRKLIRDYEFYSNSNRKHIKFQVLVCTWETLMGDIEELSLIPWYLLVVDEGHRLKNRAARILEALKYLNVKRKIVLTGTPIQNSTEELFTLLNFIEPKKFFSRAIFTDRYGDLKDSAHVTQLQQLIQPFMLRRMKETVEKSIPPKEETIIDIELTTLQKQYYRAIYEKNVAFLRKGCSASNMPRLINIEMELRKCCNHPWLIKGAELREVGSLRDYSTELYFERTVEASGKLVLLSKLLTKLHMENHKILIFSQMVKVLDILADFLAHAGYGFERLDGSCSGNVRQAAIDRFCRKGSSCFVFLLSTRAGGLGLNLHVADTVIIYDSDWNPQQDIQAQARCHRIGQTRPVRIYRLVTKNTYETQMFERASRKLGLDQAVLTTLERDGSANPIDIDHDSNETQDANRKRNIDRMLKLGAYSAFDEDDSASRTFCEADIEEILQTRTRKVTLNNPDSSEASDKTGIWNFNKMVFSSELADSSLNINDPEFWDKLGLTEAGEKAAQAAVSVQETAALVSSLLKGIQNGSAIASFQSRARFFDDLEQVVERSLDFKSLGTPFAYMDLLVCLLNEFSSSIYFASSARQEADSWLRLLKGRARALQKARHKPQQEDMSDDDDDDSDEETRLPRRSTRRRSRYAENEADRYRSFGSGSNRDVSLAFRGQQKRQKRSRKQKNKKVKEREVNQSSSTDSEYAFEIDSATSSDFSDDDIFVPESSSSKPRKVVSQYAQDHAVCSLCKIRGTNHLIFCHGDCRRALHLDCLHLETDHPHPEIPEGDSSSAEYWICGNCIAQVHYCSICNKQGASYSDLKAIPDGDDSVLVKCRVKSCGRFFHLNCLKEFPLTKFIANSTTKFRCSIHYCLICHKTGDASSAVVHCANCPTAFHLKCLPEDSTTRLSRRYCFCPACTIKGRDDDVLTDAIEYITSAQPIRKRRRRGLPDHDSPKSFKSHNNVRVLFDGQPLLTLGDSSTSSTRKKNRKKKEITDDIDYENPGDALISFHKNRKRKMRSQPQLSSDDETSSDSKPLRRSHKLKKHRSKHHKSRHGQKKKRREHSRL